MSAFSLGCVSRARAGDCLVRCARDKGAISRTRRGSVNATRGPVTFSVGDSGPVETSHFLLESCVRYHVNAMFIAGLRRCRFQNYRLTLELRLTEMRFEKLQVIPKMDNETRRTCIS